MTVPDAWPALPYDGWKETNATLHLWMQIVGKIRLVQTPWTNHSWHVALYLTTRGLSTSPIPHGARSFQIDFDFIDHQLRIGSSDGMTRSLPLRAQPVADFYHDLLTALDQMGLHVRIHPVPNEIPDAIPFDQDRVHASYDGEYANRCWRAMMHTERVLDRFRARYCGKCSPVHVFWGGFDLAVTRFSGRRAPEHPGGVPNLPDWVAREAYSHEVSSCGFWPGGPALPAPVFYAYAYPEPPGFASAAIRPEAAYYHEQLREFVLPYDDVRRAESPDDRLIDFFQSTYEAAASLGNWNRAELEFGPHASRVMPGMRP
jgi:hypothetical protein